MSGVNVVKLRGSRNYLKWMRANAGKVKVKEVQSRDLRWLLSMGEKDYLVTYTSHLQLEVADD